MKPRRKPKVERPSAQVISLAGYRGAHRRGGTEPAQETKITPRPSLMDLYCRWLALAGAAWAFWW